MIENESIWVCMSDSGCYDADNFRYTQNYVGHFKATVTKSNVEFNVIQPNYSATYKRFIVKIKYLNKIRSDEYVMVGNEVVVKERDSIIPHKCGFAHHFYRANLR